MIQQTLANIIIILKIILACIGVLKYIRFKSSTRIICYIDRINNDAFHEAFVTSCYKIICVIICKILGKS